MTPAVSVSRPSVLAPLAMALGALLVTAPMASAGTVVPFERTGEGEASTVDLIKKQYGDQEVETGSSLVVNRWNTFRSFQNALMEMMIDPAESQKLRDSYYKDRGVFDTGYNNPNPKGWRFTYWNRGELEAKTPLADGSGKVARTPIIPREVPLDGKNLYIPDAATLDKIAEIFNQQQELGKDLPMSADPPQPELDAYNQATQKLEQQFLALVASEIPKLREAAKNGKVYGLGYMYDENDTMQPLELNVPMIESQMRRMGVQIPSGDGPVPAPSTTAPAAVSVADGPPTVIVKQPPQTLQEMNRDYEAFVAGFPDESSRTKAEIEMDMFRMRIRPRDVQPGIKVYDPLLTHEYQQGGLNLPARSQDGP